MVDLLEHCRLIFFLGGTELFLQATDLVDHIELRRLSCTEWVLEQSCPNIDQQGLFFGNKFWRLD